MSRAFKSTALAKVNGTMSTHRTKTCLLAGMLLAALCAPAHAQVEDLQFFAPRDLSDYGGYPEANRGWFGAVDYLEWNISAPEYANIGSSTFDSIIVYDGNGLRPTFNALNTGSFKSQFSSGRRIEFGHMDKHWGWSMTLQQTTPQTSRITAGHVDILFDDYVIEQPYNTLYYLPDGQGGLEPVWIPTIKTVGGLNGWINSTKLDAVDDNFDYNWQFGRYWDGNGNNVIEPDAIEDQLEPVDYDYGDSLRLPVVFREVRVKNVIDTTGVDLMPTYRSDQLHHGGYLEFGIGAKFQQMNEEFLVQGWGGIFDQSQWRTVADNNIIGPQVSARWFRERGAWNLSVGAKGFFGFNYQNVRQKGNLASRLGPNINADYGDPPTVTTFRPDNMPLAFTPTSFEHSFNTVEFAPGVELRADVSYKLTRAINLRVGWTGTFQDSLARPSNMVWYSLPTMGILQDNNTQDLFMHGVNVGIEVNR